MARPSSKAIVAAGIAVALASCGVGRNVTGSAVSTGVHPTLDGPTFTTFSLQPPGSTPSTVALGSDGNIWFAQTAPYIGRITPSGSITEFPIPSGHHANDITPGARGTLWFSEFRASKIGRISVDGTIKEFGGPKQLTYPSGLTLGSDGNIWFHEQRGPIGRMTPDGKFTEFNPPSTTVGDITLGPDGNVWFVDGPDVGFITPSGQLTDYANPQGIDENMSGITAGPDGDVYAGERGRHGYFITQITPGGVFKRFHSPLHIYELTLAPDDTIWATGVVGTYICGSGPHKCVPAISSFVVATHSFSTPVQLPGPKAEAQDLTASGKAIWFASGTGDYIGEYK